MFKSIALLALVAAAEARQCKNITVPVQLSQKQPQYSLKPLNTETDVTNFFLDFSRPGNNVAANYMTGSKQITGNYKLAATYCEPDAGPGQVLEIMTHGVGFDRSYWDLPLDNYHYSYVNVALAAGHSTLTWDRLGIAESSHGDPVNEIQISLEIAALAELTKIAKDGKLCGVKQKFTKTVHLGHSFGSLMTYALSAMAPDFSNVIVLTGYSQVTQFISLFALGGNFAPVKDIPSLAGKYADGYVGAKDEIGVHINFFGPGDFAQDALDYGFTHGQPASLGELLSLQVPGASTTDFSGAALIITGNADIPFCGGNCTNTMAIMGKAANLLEPAKDSFKKASNAQAIVVPKAGHGLNLASSAPSTYRQIADYIKAHL